MSTCGELLETRWLPVPFVPVVPSFLHFLREFFFRGRREQPSSVIIVTDEKDFCKLIFVALLFTFLSLLCQM
jgi:hypothetical protein